MKKIYIITGRTGSGKSTLCKRLAKELDLTLLSFANMGKKFANNHGYERIRECHLAMELNEFKEKMTNHLLKSIEASLELNDIIMIDGLYIDTVVAKLKEKYQCFLIYLNTNDTVRYQRISQRLSITIEEAQEENKIKERLKDEVGINELIKNADYEINGDNSPENIYEEVYQIIKKS